MSEGDILNISMRNFNLKSRSIKEGMIYRLEVEVDELDYDHLKTLSLTGLVAEAELHITHENSDLFDQDDEPDKAEVEAAKVSPYKNAKIGPICTEANDYCKAPQFQQFMALLSEHKDKISVHFAAKQLKKICCITSKKALDDPGQKDSLKKYKMTIVAYRSWLAEPDNPGYEGRAGDPGPQSE